MQRINIDVFCWSFSLLFFTLPIALTGLAILALQNMSTPHAPALIAASILYVCGAFLVTIFGNVPLNNALAKVDADSNEGAGIRIDFLHRWVRWNHVRTVACLAAASVLVFA